MDTISGKIHLLFFRFKIDKFADKARMIKKAGVNILLVAVILLSPNPLQAGLEEGIFASHRGDYITAFREFRSLANEGHAKAQFRLGLLYEMGLGVKQNYSEAAKWYRKAAVQGNIESQKRLILMHKKGLTDSRQPTVPPEWQGSTTDPQSQYDLGVMYFMGIGVGKNYLTASEWFRKSANQSYTKAQHDLALMLLQGKGVSQDALEAYKWFHLAARQGDGPSQYQLGRMLSHGKGKGIPQHFTLAYMWFEIAAAHGFEKAKEKQKQLAGRMTEEQVKEAKIEAKKWQMKNKPIN
jgi:TPR repeat protein